MPRRFNKSGTAPLKLAALLALGTAAHAAMPYLPLVGPPALRMEKVKGPAAEAIKPSVQSFTAPATNAPLVAKNPVPSETNSMATGPGPSGKASPAVAPPGVPPSFAVSAPEINQPLGDAFSASIFILPQPDLLGITPQTLAAYFHPVYADTNAPVVGPFPLTFIPPMPPDKSSHAEYILK